MGRAFVCVFLAAAGCATPEDKPAPPVTGLDLAAARLVDLSYAYDETTIYWPTSRA
jgi:hypothetical protein